MRAYNRRAFEIAAHFGQVNGLYGLVMDAGRDVHLAQDGVHFTPEGYTLLGNAVADAIRPLL